MNDTLMLVGRILIAFIFVAGGYEKAMHGSDTIAHIAQTGLPVPPMAFATAVFVELGVGLALLFGLFTRLAGLVLAVWCLVTAAIYHNDVSVLMQQIQLTKNMAMAGGLLYVAAFGGGAFSIDALRGRRAPVALGNA